MADNEQQSAPEGNEGKQPEGQRPEERDGDDRRRSFLKMIKRMARMLRDDREKMMKVIKEGDRTADGQESPTLVEVDPAEMPFKKGNMVALSKVDPQTNTVRAKMSDWGEMDEDVALGESLSLNEGAGATSPVTQCLMDQYGNAYVRTKNSVYRLDAVERAEEEAIEILPALPDIDVDWAATDKPMPSISDVVAENARKREEEKNGASDSPSN